MARAERRDRRLQLVKAAREVLLERGAVGVRVKDVADRAGLAPSLVLYYYPRIEELLLEVSREAISRYAERRAESVRRLDAPDRQLRLAVHLGVPTGPDDDESKLLYELDAFTGSSSAFAVLSASFFDRQALVYESILEAGAESGAFTLTGSAQRLARGLVALEDGLGLQVVLGHPSVDREEAERVLLAYAGAATGVDLGTVPLDGAGGRPPSPIPRGS